MADFLTNFGPCGLGFAVIPTDSPLWTENGNSFSSSLLSSGNWELVVKGTNLYSLNPPVAHPNSGTIIPAGMGSIWGTPPVAYIRPEDSIDSSTNSFPYIAFTGGSSPYPINHYVGRDNLVADYVNLLYSTGICDEVFFVNLAWPGGDIGVVAVTYRRSDNSYLISSPAPSNGRTPKDCSVYAFQVFHNWINRPIPDTPTSPDYGGNSNTTGGGKGDFDNTSSYPGLTPITTLENSSFITYGLISVYTPSAAQLRHVRDYMWGSSFWQALQKLVPGQDPTKYIISTHLVPLARSQLSARTGKFQFGIFTRLEEWKLIPMADCDFVINQYVDVSLGEFEITEYSGDFTNYSPYAQYSIYLPYIGVRNLGADIIVGKKLNLVYRIDLATGAAVAYILHDGNVLFSFTGCVSTQIPLSGDNSSLASVGAAVAVSGVAAATMSGAIGIAAIGSSAVKAGATAGLGAMAANIANPEATVEAGQSAFSGASTAAINQGISEFKTPSVPPSSIAGAASLLHKSYQIGDANMGVNLGIVNQQSAYLIRVLPNTATPSEYRSLHGYVSNVSQRIGNFKGFTVFSDFHLDGLTTGTHSPTLTEIEMISARLKEGIII